MKFYKSLLFLLVINLLCTTPVWAFFGIRFLIPTLVFLLTLNLFLIFFSYLYFKKYTFSFFTMDDPYKASQIFKDLQKIYNIKNVQILKTASQTECHFFCFANGNKYSIAFSEKFLDSFSKQDIKILLSYVLKMIQIGDLFFLNLLSGFLFLIEKTLYYLNYPFYFLSKKPVKKENLALILILRALSPISRRIYKNLDKAFSFQENEKGQLAFSFQKNENEKEQLAFLLWKMHSLAKVYPSKTPVFWAPFFLINPLTDSGWDCYISLHPLIRDRLQSLGVNYPP